ncbi:hypothetical protein NQZ79_g5194 [Umbelopsis isabellina]|nr:hypothetical protein NQZ79_g5194 [Umbelopsis isabellina]
MNPQHRAVLDSLFAKTVSLRTYICQHGACRVGIADKLKYTSTRLQELLDTALATHTPSIEKNRDSEYSWDNRFTTEDMWSDRNNSLIKQDEIKNGTKSSISGHKGTKLPIEQAYSNTLVSELKRPHWKELLQILLVCHNSSNLESVSDFDSTSVVGTVIHELKIAAEPVPVPHHVPACVDDIFLPNLRMPCCETTTQNKSSHLPAQKTDSVKKRKRSRCQKSRDKFDCQASADVINTGFEKENRDTSYFKPCRRERKRQRISSMKISASKHVLMNNNAGVKEMCSEMTTTSTKRTHTEAMISCYKEESDVKEAKRIRGLSSLSGSTSLLKRCLMFYGEPKADKQNQISMKLPRDYMLTLPVSKLRNAASSRSRNHVLSSAALDVLLTDIFPKQYRKPNVLQGTVTELTTLQRKNPFLEIKPYYRKWRLPPRLQQFKEYFATICKQHSKMDYKRILDRFCPTKVQINSLHMPRTYVRSVLLCYSALKKYFPTVFGDPKRTFKPFQKVNGFDLNKDLPPLLVLTLQLPAVHKYISLRKFETLSLTQLMQSFKIKHCSHLSKSNPKNIFVTHPAPSEMLKREEIMKEFLFWLFQYYITPLLSDAHSMPLQVTFFITDNSQYRNRTFYFRKDVWHAISQPALCRLISVNFTTFDACKFEFSCLRLLPKGANVRPITNMKRRFQKDTNGSQTEQTTYNSANKVLDNALRALTFEKEENPELLGSSIMSFEGFYKTLANYKEWYLSAGKTISERPNLYFAKVDIKNCFDSIEQDVLLGILDKILSQVRHSEIFLKAQFSHMLKNLPSKDEYIIKRYTTMFATTGGKIHFRHRKYAQSAGMSALLQFQHDYDSFQTQALEMSDTLPNTIFVDNVFHKFEDRDELLELIRKHIKCNVVKVTSPQTP